ncbi:MAG: VOC family protein [Marinibacterium sp.]|nr:VOC family protein [Marinibacterium sp.]
MKLWLHHVNVVSHDVPGLDRFYRDVMGMGDERPENLPRQDKTNGYAGDVAFVTDGQIQMHLAERDIGAGFRTGQIVNPVARGHIAFRTDDLDAFRAHLDAKGIPYSDWGGIATADWHQIFFYDPDGNVIEVHQVNDTAPD